MDSDKNHKPEIGPEEKLSIELEEKTKLAEERLNQLKYLQADFDNYRKKFEKEKEDIIKLANENLIKELLVVVDDFERCLKQINDEKMSNGLLLLQRNFLKILEKHGLKRIDALGKKFDPNFHEVLLKGPGDKEGVVLEELQKGFMLKTKVIRHSLVKISESFRKSLGKNDDELFFEKENLGKENEKETILEKGFIKNNK